MLGPLEILLQPLASAKATDHFVPVVQRVLGGCNRAIPGYQRAERCPVTSLNPGLEPAEIAVDTWMEFNAGLGDLSIFDLCFNQDHLVAATNASGIWRLPFTWLCRRRRLADMISLFLL